MDKLSIMGVRIDNKSMNETMEIIKDKISNNEQYIIYTPNTEIVMMCHKDQEFMDLVNKSHINVPDGIGLIYASKLKGHPLKEKVAGYDLSVNMLKLANKHRLKLFVVGGKPGIADEAMVNVHNEYHPCLHEPFVQLLNLPYRRLQQFDEEVPRLHA